MRPVMDEFICVNLDVIADRPVDFIQSLVEGYIRYDGVHIKKNYRVEYGKMDKEGNNHIYVLEAPDGACDYDMAVSVFAMVCIEGKAPSDVLAQFSLPDHRAQCAGAASHPRPGRRV